MCYSISSTSSVETLAKRYNREAYQKIEVPPLYYVSGFSFPKIHCIASDRKIQTMQWGLIPHWYQGKKENISSKTLNARIETLQEKISFKHLLYRNHCVAPINGFFEWKTSQKRKTPYFIYPSHSDHFLCACIFDDWLNPNSGETVRTFSIVTTVANDLMSEIHNEKKRMPLLLEENELENWIKGEFPKMETFKSENMRAHVVNHKNLINHLNIPEARLPFSMNESDQLSLFS